LLSADTLAVLKQPFQRGTSLGSGGGLGLAIVENIMTQLGGRLVLASPATGRAAGIEAVLEFPALHTDAMERSEPGGWCWRHWSPPFTRQPQVKFGGQSSRT
jgi:K+-sensing histidine kinase KdpD